MGKASGRKGKKVVRLGVVGAARGLDLARLVGPEVGMEIVAVCDTRKARLRKVAEAVSAASYTDVDRFFEHEMDAVLLANYFHEHAPLAIKALEAGLHVLSETLPCYTPAEGVALVEAVERSKGIYMFAENYPYMVCNQEMRRLYRAGRIGRFQYGEGEYVHPMSVEQKNRLSPGVRHWRNWLPATYYCTHGLAPVMYIADVMPAKVNAFVMSPDPKTDPQVRRTAAVRDVAACLIVRMRDGSVAKALHGNLRGHGNWVRIHGTHGLMENMRSGHRDMLRVRREPFEKKPDEPAECLYTPDFPLLAAEARKAGHGGGDLFVLHHFAEAIRRNRQPYLNVYRAVAMALVGIQGWRSALDDANAKPVPDFKKKRVRDAYREDDFRPDPSRPDSPPVNLCGTLKPAPEGVRYAKKIWRATGQEGP
jgi:predicted dehydrogenase